VYIRAILSMNNECHSSKESTLLRPSALLLFLQRRPRKSSPLFPFISLDMGV